MKSNKDFFVVGIGASAGGLDAVQKLFDHIPDQVNVAFIIIQHLSPDFVSLMPELLSKHTQLKIYTAEEGQTIEPNCIYLNQRNKNIGIEGNQFVLFDKAPKNQLNLPIDILFHMLGESFNDRAIGVVLSGTGSDGSRGIKSIKEAGGVILVQDPATAQFDGMPNSALLTNLADFVLSPSEIAQKIIFYTANKLNLTDDELLASNNESVFREILLEVERFSGIDFRKYKNNTLLRRIEKQMNLNNLLDMDSYLGYVRNNPKEISILNQEFLIGVTNFFRDKAAFEIIKSVVVPNICKAKLKEGNIRVWVVGCSSGEEVYSLAMLFDQYITLNKQNIDFKIFATDIDKRALKRASLGVYAINNCVEIGDVYLNEYFLKTGNSIQIVKKLRDKVVFSYHDVTKDPPFIKLDLISCRNMLIYFTNASQKQILQGFQFALNKNGFLFLGSSESLGTISSSFKVIDSKNKVFQSIQENRRYTREGVSLENVPHNHTRESEAINFTPKSYNVENKKNNELNYFKYLSKKHSPVTVFVDKDFNVQFIMGEFKKWFRQSDGLFSNNLLQMVPSELSIIIRKGVKKVMEIGDPVYVKNFECEIGGNQLMNTNLYFDLAQMPDVYEKVYLVQFGESIPLEGRDGIRLTDRDVSNFTLERINDLESELKENRQELQNLVEELETSNEELQSSNEELMSSNEELQSSNEELQSVNEELYTVNSEFQEKNRELENLNNDVNNLLNSIDVGTLFLDINLQIRKFTPTIKRVFHLEESDIGRSLLSFASEFDEVTRREIVTNAKKCLETLQTYEKEICDLNGKWFLKKISPFVTTDKKIEGVVVTFVDISIIKSTKSELVNVENRLSTAMEAGNMAWWEMRLPSGLVYFDRKKVDMLGRNPADFSHYQHFVDLVHPEDQEICMKAMKDHLEGMVDTYNCEYRIQDINGKYIWFHDIGKVVSNLNGELIVTGIVIEITSKKQAEFQLVHALRNAESANIYKNQFLANMSHEIRTPINGLLGFANLLKNNKLDQDSINECVDIIDSCSTQLLNLINDILDIAKIEAGELSIKLETCEVNRILLDLEKTFENIRILKEKKDVKFLMHIPEGSQELYMKTDPVRLNQILTNLLSNALKFTEAGKIEFGYTLESSKIKFYVSDTGIGISTDKLNLIFERFQQVEQQDKAKYDGTGLGLAICKGLVKLLGGNISVTSTLGEGSVFHFDIPLKRSSEQIIPDNTEEGINLNTKFQGKTILVAEDDPFNQYLLKKMLGELPIKVLWANNGAEAVDLYKSHNEIAITLMDIRMPKVDGFEATKQILEINPNAKIIAQTAYAMSSDKEKCLQNGFVDYLSKPLAKTDFVGTMAKWID